MTRISTLSQNQFILRNTQLVQERMQELRNQVATGTKADEFIDLGSKSLSLTTAFSRMARAEQFLENNVQTKTKLDLRETAVREIAEIAKNLKAEFIQAEGLEDARQLQVHAQNEIERVVAILNSRDQNGNYLFAGSRTNLVPVTITTNGFPPPAFIFGFNNDQVIEQARVDESVVIDIGVLAGANTLTPAAAFVGLIGTLNYFAAGRYPPPVPGTPPLPSPGVLPVAGAAPLVITKINAGLASINQLNADLGIKQKLVEDLNVNLQEEIDLSKEFIGELNDADLAELLTRISQDEITLEASYRVTGSLRDLSLVNFI
jgi:flagellar hook-associated protein 3 FlgL